MDSRCKLRSLYTLLAAAFLAGLSASSVSAQIISAGNLLVEIDAATFTSGSVTLTNTGTLGGAFGTVGTTPTRININGAAGIFFDETDVFVGPNSTGAIDGLDQTVSIEVWTQQGFIREEETLVSWSKRGGPDGSNMSLNYGTDDRWGAVDQWGSSSMGWGPNDPNGSGGVAPGTPVAGQWHHLVYTYDGTTQRIYQDGVLVNFETVSLNIHQGLPIQIGAQRESDGVTVTEGLRLGGVISKVRIHDGALTGAQVAQNFTVEKASFGYDVLNAYVKTGAPLSAGPVHRYTFNDLAGAGDGTVIPDVAGVGANQADGVLRGANATVAGIFGIDLPGGASATEAYIDLPNGIVSGSFNGGTPYASASYEVWVTIQSNQNWSRILDFGSSDGGEVIGPGGAGAGTNYVILGANAALDNVLRLQRFGIGSGVRQTEGNNGLGTEIHLVLTYSAVDQEWDFFRNGIAMEGFSSNGGPDTINDVNNWLGRSQWGADSNTDAIYNEFRIYDYVLTPDQVQGNFVSGPDVVNVIPEPVSVALLALGAVSTMGLLRRRDSKSDS